VLAPRRQINTVTASVNEPNPSAVEVRITEAILPLSAPRRSANMEAFVADGRAATRTITTRVDAANGRPMAITPSPTDHTTMGWTTSFSAVSQATSPARLFG